MAPPVLNTDGAGMCALVYVCVGMSENLEGLQRSLSSSSNTLQHSVLNFLKKIKVVFLSHLKVAKHNIG